MGRENIKLSLIISLIVVISLSSTYAYLVMSASYSDDNVTSGNAGCFVVNYSGQDINNASLKSTSNYAEGAKSNIILSKNVGCKVYTEASIYLRTFSDGTTAPLSDGAMKYKVMQGTTELSTGSVSEIIGEATDQLLATVPLTDTNVTYTVYLWIDPAISQGSYHGKTYSGYLFASSTQSSTITE